MGTSHCPNPLNISDYSQNGLQNLIYCRNNTENWSHPCMGSFTPYLRNWTKLDQLGLDWQLRWDGTPNFAIKWDVVGCLGLLKLWPAPWPMGTLTHDPDGFPQPVLFPTWTYEKAVLTIIGLSPTHLVNPPKVPKGFNKNLWFLAHTNTSAKLLKLPGRFANTIMVL